MKRFSSYDDVAPADRVNVAKRSPRPRATVSPKRLAGVVAITPRFRSAFNAPGVKLSPINIGRNGRPPLRFDNIVHFRRNGATNLSSKFTPRSTSAHRKPGSTDSARLRTSGCK